MERVRGEGLDDEALRAIGGIGFQFNLMNRLADAFDFEVPKGKQKARMAKLLDAGGRRLAGAKPATIATRGDDGRVRPTEVEHLRATLLSAPGLTAPELRKEIDAFVRNEWQCPGFADAEVPHALKRYLQKLARFAYRIVDEDVETMRDAGFVDEAIYEITATGAVAAACIGVEQLFEALDRSATKAGGGRSRERSSSE